MVKRWAIREGFDFPSMQEDEVGGFVTYSDHMSALTAAVADIKKIEANADYHADKNVELVGEVTRLSKIHEYAQHKRSCQTSIKGITHCDCGFDATVAYFTSFASTQQEKLDKSGRRPCPFPSGDTVIWCSVCGATSGQDCLRDETINIEGEGLVHRDTLVHNKPIAKPEQSKYPIKDKENDSPCYGSDINDH